MSRLALVDPRNKQFALGDLIALKLRLRDPGQDVVVATDVRHEMHRFAATGVAVTGFAVPLLFRQARQDLLHVQPFVRVQPFLGGQFAGVVEVTAADVVGGQGEPGAIRFLDRVVQLVLHVGQVLGATHDALLRIEAVGHAHGLRGVLGQHHQATHASLGRDGRLPQRLLIADRSQQAPVDFLLLGVGLEVLFVLGQALLQMLGKGGGAHVAEDIDMPVVAVLEALQGAVLLDLVEVIVDFVEQAVVLARGDGPALVARVTEVEGDPDVGEVHLVHRHFVGVDQCQVDLAFVHHAQEIDDLDRVGLFVFNAGKFLLQLRELFGVGAALEHHDLLAHQILRIGRPGLAVAVDDLRGDFQIGVGEAHLLLALFAADQAGSRQHRSVGLADLVEQIIEVVGGLDLQLDPQIVGEALHQLVFEAGFTVAILKVGGGAVSGNHPQHTILLYALERVGFINTATEHQEESGCDQPFGVPRTQSRWEKHLRSIRKGPRAPYLDSEGLVC
ncbi:hypothetical protein EMIT0P4_30194 [Pseudomonas sp. IT-P4]